MLLLKIPVRRAISLKDVTGYATKYSKLQFHDLKWVFYNEFWPLWCYNFWKSPLFAKYCFDTCFVSMDTCFYQIFHISLKLWTFSLFIFLTLKFPRGQSQTNIKTLWNHYLLTNLSFPNSIWKLNCPSFDQYW